MKRWGWGAIAAMALAEAAAAGSGGLSLEDRVACQRAVEQVYWRHRGAAGTPSARTFEEAVPEALLRRRAEDALRQSAALEAEWAEAIGPERLQAEIDRIAASTRSPQVLGELVAALGSDPQRVAECLARPLLVDRLLRGRYAADSRVHGALRRQARAELASAAFRRGELRTFTWMRGRDAAGAARIDARILAPEVYDRQVEALKRREAGAGPTAGASGFGPLREDDRRLYAVAIDVVGPTETRVRSVSWPKADFDGWWDVRRDRYAAWRPAEPVGFAGYRLPALAPNANCRDDSWKPTLAGLDGRYEHGAVWTGSEMIVWGGMEAVGVVYADGARYDPATDTWRPVSNVNAPSARHAFSTAWTGREMLVFGGTGDRSGGRYDPVTDTWRPMREDGAPIGQQWSASVWTGRELIVWGGILGVPVATGGRYDPQADRWRALPPAPLAPRAYMPATWTGREMIVWSGYDVTQGRLYADGARYDPATDRWTAMNTAGAPQPTYFQTEVWTGREMITWGGAIGDSANGRYDPATDTWAPVTNTGAPANRLQHGAVWTGTEMLVQGGWPSAAPGGLYDPATDHWRPAATLNAPPGTAAGTLVWAGREAFAWGGLDDTFSFRNDGARYDPVQDRWRPMNLYNVPAGRGLHVAEWTGAEMIVWGGTTAIPSDAGARYDPATDSWRPIATAGQPAPRQNAASVWTGREMIVWGAGPGDPFTPDSGGRYDPSADTWVPMSRKNAPFVTYGHSAVWTGTEMIVYGGISSSDRAKRYDPATDTWTNATRRNDPGHRDHHGAVWTGTEMIVWGGSIDAGIRPTGGRYDPATDTWTRTPIAGSPAARMWPVAVWTGREAIFWGGYDQLFGVEFGDGARFDPGAGTWAPTTLVGAPVPRVAQGVWTGREMIVWGDANDRSGGRYDPAADRWQPTSLVRAPVVPSGGRWSTVWTGEQMIVWGGYGPTQMGALYCASGAPNLAPFAQADRFRARSGRPLVVGTDRGVLGNDSDGNADPVTARLVEGPAHGQLQFFANGAFRYRSAPGFVGIDGFRYVANDDLADSAPATVRIDVR